MFLNWLSYNSLLAIEIDMCHITACYDYLKTYTPPCPALPSAWLKLVLCCPLCLKGYACLPTVRFYLALHSVINALTDLMAAQINLN